MKKIILLCFVFINFISCTSVEEKKEMEYKYISVEEYQKAVYASWIGQIVGNTYGLCYEFKFIEEAGPDSFPYGYTWTLDLLKQHNGAFSDDDTDIEYMYLTQMEKNGIEPTYFNLAEAWKSHVSSKVWCANRVALTLMHAGHFPPVTGSKQFNPQWMQIDPQLVNEIWAVTAPGMIKYAVDKSEFAARITNDDFGIEPTLHYAAMYSAAFFEKDINKLIEIGNNSLKANAKFTQTVDFVKQLHSKYPENWQEARKQVVKKYFVKDEHNKYAWEVVDANLNGALGIMALLYGKGNFQKTLDFACAFGMDADNQAATMCGLLGIVNGLDAIPNDLLFPVKELNWTEPFNNQYKMITREGLASETLTGLAQRTVKQAEKIILANGGEIVEKEGKKVYKINVNAEFIAPFELNQFPDFAVEVNHEFSYPIYTGRSADVVELKLSGNIPDGLRIENGKLIGKPNKVGKYKFQVSAKFENTTNSETILFSVHSANLAPLADRVVYNENALDKNIEKIRDGKTNETYYSIRQSVEQEVDNYGYIWADEQKISALSFNNGVPNEFAGWFTSFAVEYLDKKEENWVKVKSISIYPELNLENNQWLKPNFIDYDISFQPIETKGIRIVGMSGGIEKDAANAHLGMQYYTAISELKVFEK